MTAPPDYFTEITGGPAPASTKWLHAADNTRLRAAQWNGSRGTVWVFQGRTEYLEKYGPTIERLTRAGWSVVAHDWRGQGLSDRPAKDPFMGDVRHFSDYQRDVDCLLADPDFAGLPKPWVLLAHSMGGSIGLKMLAQSEAFNRAVFSAPMWDLPRPGVFNPLAETGLRLAISLGFGQRYFVGGGPRNHTLTQPFALNPLTSDRENYDRLIHHLKTHPELGLGGPSMRWVRAALRQAKHLRRLDPPSLPILTLLGTRELVVATEAIKQHSARQPNARLVEISGARHEILIETPERQAQAWEEIDGFLADL
ncbi:MAG: alpha/beta hydrolase [Pseudomonadota bacterium]